MKILPNLYMIPGVIANTFLLVDDGVLTLIDSGLPRRAPQILRFIASLGYTPEDLIHILVTHADSDHIGGLAALQAAAPALTFASPVEAGAIRAGEFSRPLKLLGWKKWLFEISTRFFKITPARVDETLSANQNLPMWGGLRVLETPGHTPGHLSFYAPQTGVLFCGDSLRCPRGEIVVSSGANTWDESVARRSALAQAQLGAKVVCAGHGPVVQDANAQFSSLRARLEKEARGVA